MEADTPTHSVCCLADLPTPTQCSLSLSQPWLSIADASGFSRPTRLPIYPHFNPSCILARTPTQRVLPGRLAPTPSLFADEGPRLTASLFRMIPITNVIPLRHNRAASVSPVFAFAAFSFVLYFVGLDLKPIVCLGPPARCPSVCYTAKRPPAALPPSVLQRETEGNPPPKGTLDTGWVGECWPPRSFKRSLSRVALGAAPFR